MGGRADVAIVGEGPAGSALAASCAEAGLQVLHLGADPGARWPATYGAWVDELDGVAGLGEGIWARRWARPLVAFDEGSRALDRPYGLVDNEALRRVLRARTVAAGGRVAAGRVVDVAHDAEGSRLALAGGDAALARVVVDATGHRAALLEPSPGRGVAHQVAYGVIAPVRRSPVPEGGMVLMDWRTGGRLAGDPPTFLYAMDLGDGRHLLEETSLAARPPVAGARLRERLHRRLAATGTDLGAVAASEQVAIPMGGPLPPVQRVVGYGAAAGMVHPATGYQMAAALRRAPDVAAALATALGGGATAEDAAAAGWGAVWPADLRRQRDLHAYGLEVLLTLDEQEVQRFFGAFFDLPQARWCAYLSGAGSSRALSAVMLDLARRLPPRLWWRVVSLAAGAGGLALLRGAAGRPS